jgi:hypothetical protein
VDAVSHRGRVLHCRAVVLAAGDRSHG